MAKRRRRRNRAQQFKIDVLSMVSSAREASRAALQELRREIKAVRRQLEKLVAEERGFRLDLFGTAAPGRPRGPRKSPKRGRPAGKNAATRKGRSRRKGPAKADTYFAKLPSKFTIEDVRKLAGKATGVSLAQWARAKKVKKTTGGYQKIAG